MQFDEAGNRQRIAALQGKGVEAWGPERVYVAPDVDLDAIEAGAVIRHATLSGSDLHIARGAIVGTSGHAEVEDCQIGPRVELGAGFYHGATFLEDVKVRGFAEIRPGTLLEEQAEAAHCVAFKNTILTSCCVAGSLINFCDLFMSGGTSRQNHSEIGSGAIHFNFDPRGDKWGSLIGDIRGLLLRSKPIFIGGNCGLVGPIQIGFGTVTVAGSTMSKNIEENLTVSEHFGNHRLAGFDHQGYSRLTHKIHTTVRLIGTLWTLDTWYGQVRLPFARPEEKPFYESARTQIKSHIQERINRLETIIAKLTSSFELMNANNQLPKSQTFLQHNKLLKNWKALRTEMQQHPGGSNPPRDFLKAYEESRATGTGHVNAVHAAADYAKETEQWLIGIVERFEQRCSQIIE